MVETISIGCLFGDGCFSATACASGLFTGGACPGDVAFGAFCGPFPLCLCRQSFSLPATISIGFIPCDEADRLVAASVDGWDGDTIGGKTVSCFDAFFVVSDTDFVFVHVEGVELDLVGGALVFCAVVVSYTDLAARDTRHPLGGFRAAICVCKLGRQCVAYQRNTCA